MVGTVLNGLSHLSAVTQRGQFIVGLLRGLGGNLNFKTRQQFAKEVSNKQTVVMVPLKDEVVHA